LRFEPNNPAPPAGRDFPLEGLRGFAALMVFYAHLTAPAAKLDPDYAPSPFWWRFEFATGAVLLFFVLSGYVIGLTNLRPASAPAVRDFWRRRFWRLFPINALAVGLAWFAPPSAAPGTLLGNLFFLQNSQSFFGLRVPLLEANPNLWSLHYEVIYYLLFPVVWSLRPRVSVLLSGLLALAALRLGAPGLALLANLAAGGCFWLAGLWLAWCSDQTGDHTVGHAWPSALLLFFVTCKLHVAEIFAQRAGLTFPWAPEVNLWHLDLLPVAILLVAAVAGRSPPGHRLCLAIAVAIPGARIIWQMWSQRGWPLEDTRLYAVFWLIALILLFWRPSRQSWSWLAPVGAFSYGLYALAVPTQVWMKHQDWIPTGSAASYLLRLVLFVCAAGFFAWLAETKLQPMIAARFRRRPPA
jgi:peptidoglycan/LPS O-acetylase OafA/YrhL